MSALTANLHAIRQVLMLLVLLVVLPACSAPDSDSAGSELQRLQTIAERVTIMRWCCAHLRRN